MSQVNVSISQIKRKFMRLPYHLLQVCGGDLLVYLEFWKLIQNLFASLKCQFTVVFKQV